eukprot:ANDGO_05580.mRNA.1 Protein PXR1
MQSNDPNNTRWAKNSSSIGHMLLAKMGWQAGNGLGAAQQGTTTHIRVAARSSTENTVGIGADKIKMDHVSEHIDEFNSVLMKLQSAHKVHSTRGIDRMDSMDNVDGVDGASIGDGITKKEGVVYGSKRVTYNRIKTAKMVQSYSDQDLANILGKYTVDRKGGAKSSGPSDPQLISGAESGDRERDCDRDGCGAVLRSVSSGSLEAFEHEIQMLKETDSQRVIKDMEKSRKKEMKKSRKTDKKEEKSDKKKDKKDKKNEKKERKEKTVQSEQSDNSEASKESSNMETNEKKARKDKGDKKSRKVIKEAESSSTASTDSCDGEDREKKKRKRGRMEETVSSSESEEHSSKKKKRRTSSNSSSVDASMP